MSNRARSSRTQLITLRVPLALAARIAADARDRRCTQTYVIIEAVTRQLGAGAEPAEAPGQGRRQGKM